MDQQQERDVAYGLRHGKTEAWQALYDAYCRRVWCAIAQLLGPDSTDIADVVQETFLAAARSARNYDPAKGTLWMWLSGIARRHVALHCRRQQRHGRVSDDNSPVARQIAGWLDDRQQLPEDVLAAAETASLVRSVLTQLPADYEELLTAKYCEGVSVDQIARSKNSSSTAVRSKLARARRAFRQVFTKTSACSNSDHGRSNDAP